MAPSEPTEDFYAILDLLSTATVAEIKRRYRELALLRHPDRNGGTPEATAAFQLLNEAHETLTDAQRRVAYDLKLPGIRRAKEAAAAAAAAKKADENAKTQDTGANLKEDLEVQQAKLDKLWRVLETQGSQQVDLMTEKKKLQRAIAQLEGDDGGERTGKEKQEQETDRLHRAAAIRIKEAGLERLGKKLEDLEKLMGNTEKDIQIQQESLDKLEAEVQARRRKEEEEEGKGQNAKQYKGQDREEEARKAERERREQESRQYAEQKVREEEAKRKAEAQAEREKAEAARKAAEEARRSKAEAEAKKAKSKSCSHKFFWGRMDGRHQCDDCRQMQNRFAFQCPGCEKVACARCRAKLRGERWKSRDSDSD